MRPARVAAAAALLLLAGAGPASAQGFASRPFSAIDGHGGDVRAVAFTLDGRHLATAGQDKQIFLWDLTQRRRLATLAGHTDTVRALAFSPGGRLLASASDDDTVRLWEVPSGRPLRVLTGHRHDVLSVDFSADGKLLASGSRDKTARLWDLETGLLQGTLTGHTDAVHTVRFNPEGRFLSTASADKTLRTYRLADRKEVRTLVEPAARWGDLFAFDFHPDGRLTATVIKEVTRAGRGALGRGGGIREDDFIQLRDGRTGEERGRLQGHLESISDVAFSPDGRLLASCGYDHSVMIWDVEQARRVAVLSSFSETKDLGRLFSLAFSPDGSFLAVGGQRRAYLWQVPGIAPVPQLVSGPDGRYKPPRLALPSGRGTRRRVTVANLAPKGQVEPFVGELLADTVRAGLMKSGRFEVLDRANLGKIVEEQRFQQLMVDEAGRAQAGKLLGLQALVTGSVGKLGGTWVITLDLTDMATGKIEQTGREPCRCTEDDLFLASQTALLRLLGASEGGVR